MLMLMKSVVLYPFCAALYTNHFAGSQDVVLYLYNTFSKMAM